jgi:hypothetical protein
MKTFKTRKSYNMMTFGGTRAAMGQVARYVKAMDSTEIKGLIVELRAELDALERREWTPIMAQIVNEWNDGPAMYGMGRAMGDKDGAIPDPKDLPIP